MSRGSQRCSTAVIVCGALGFSLGGLDFGDEPWHGHGSCIASSFNSLGPPQLAIQKYVLKASRATVLIRVSSCVFHYCGSPLYNRALSPATAVANLFGALALEGCDDDSRRWLLTENESHLKHL